MSQVSENIFFFPREQIFLELFSFTHGTLFWDPVCLRAYLRMCTIMWNTCMVQIFHVFPNVYDYVGYMFGSDLSRIFLLLEIAVTINAFEPSDHVNNQPGFEAVCYFC